MCAAQHVSLRARPLPRIVTTSPNADSEPAKPRQAFGAWTARTQERRQSWPTNLSRDAFCAAFRRDSESADEAGW
eukprot:8378668-Alexandrium_andersonii.AAC.1